MLRMFSRQEARKTYDVIIFALGTLESTTFDNSTTFTADAEMFFTSFKILKVVVDS